jgi:hypothetical protein
VTTINSAGDVENDANKRRNEFDVDKTTVIKAVEY